MDEENNNVENNETNLETQYTEFLKKFIEENCNSNGKLVAYWGYDDVISADMIKEAADYAIEKDTTFEQAILADHDWVDSWIIDLEDNFEDEALSEMPEELKEYMRDESRDLLDDLFDNGFSGVDILAHARYDDICVNIIMATPSEANFDMESIETTYGLGDYSADVANEFPEYHDNMLTEYLKSQGRTEEDLLNALENGTEDKFLKACTAECYNTYGMVGLTVLARLDANEYMVLRELQHSGSGSFTINTSADSLGLFDPWSGKGSLLELPLEKPMTVPVANIHTIQVEGAKGNNGYTVDEVYGLVGGAWKTGAITINNK